MIAVLGPTNTGKTHFAVERMLAHASGMIGFPLRLLAREIFDRVVAERGPRVTALITGEEKIIPEDPRYFICTVEAMPLSRQTEFLAIDEVQLAADPDRGHVFTQRILGARGIAETVLLGSQTAEGLIRRLLPHVEIRTRPRLSRLSYAGPRKLSRLPPRTAVVAFSAEDVHDIAVALRRRRGGCAIVMGALSPRTRNAQVALYQSGDVDFLVATDAIGMGLNMDIDHVAFASLAKFDGRQNRRLTDAEIGQIAGRAGRYMRDGTFGVTEPLTGFDQPLIEALEGHDFPPLRALQWRNGRPDTRTLGALLRSLDDPPPDPALLPTRDAEDHLVLKALAEQPEIVDRAKDPDGVALLWEACQTPDFAQVGSGSHARLIARIFVHLRDDGVLPVDWVANHVARLERVEGDIGALLERIARIRTWTYLAHHGEWMADAVHWQERTRGIEDLLSDALHDRLTDQFVDPYAVTAGRRRRKHEEEVVARLRDGAVWVGDERIGVMAGLGFTPDPDSGLDPDGLRRRTAGYGDTALARGVRRALREGMPGWVDGIVGAADDAFRLGGDGALRWDGSEIARLKGDREVLSPAVQLTGGDSLEPADRDRLVARLKAWTEGHLRSRLGALFALREAELGAHARGLAFQLVDGLGTVPRAQVRGHLDGLGTERKALRGLGVNFGRYALSVPALARPEAVRLRALLWCLHNDKPMPNLPARRGRSVPVDPAAPEGFYPATGYVRVARRAIPIWLFDRLADAAASALRRGRLTASPQLAAYADLTLAEVREVLAVLGFRQVQDGDGAHYVPGRARRDDDRPRGQQTEGERTRPGRRRGRGPRPDGEAVADGAAARPDGDRQDRPARTRHDKPRKGGPKPKDKDRRPQGGGRQGPTRREPAFDPDSPFAVLQALKQSMTGG
ncbi:MAG: helicase-related protein [Alphaproteobacteria bacterium]